MHEIQLHAGQHIESAAKQMVTKSALLFAEDVQDVRVACRFNNITLIADYTSCVEDIIADFNAQSEARSKAYNESPEGQRAARAYLKEERFEEAKNAAKEAFDLHWSGFENSAISQSLKTLVVCFEAYERSFVSALTHQGER